ncbi:hypothetical protein [Pseudoalteromonas sp. GB43]
MEYSLIEQLPSAEEYCAMRLKAGLSARSLAAAKAGLPNSLYAICIRKNDELIGMVALLVMAAVILKWLILLYHLNIKGKG